MKTQCIGIAILFVGMLSCTSGTQTPKPVATPASTAAPAQQPLPRDENGNDLLVPEIVHSRQVRIEGSDVKTVIVGNENGEYDLFCNTKAGNCLTPVPAKGYYVFNSTTKWKTPGAKEYITLKWIQDWTVSYNKAENIALVPVEGGAPDEIGMYGLSSWKAHDKK
jgi:hypothetical protein